MKARLVLPAFFLALATLVTIPLAQADGYDDDDRGRGHRRGLVGTWRFTGFAPGLGAFYDYVVFHRDRTLTERVSFRQESIGSGVWKFVGFKDGLPTFAATFETFRDDDLNGTVDFRTRARITVQVDGDTLTGTGTLEFRSVADNELQIGPLPPATFVGERMTVIPQ